MKEIKLIVILMYFLSYNSQIVKAQKNNDIGTLRIMLYDFCKYNIIEDSCFISIYETDVIIKKINLSEIILIQKAEITKIILKEGNYIILIENLIQIPILYTNVKIRKNKYSYFPINIEELQKENNLKKGVLIKDFNKNFQKFLDDNPPIVN